MSRIKNVLIVMVLGLLVFMCCVQEDDVKTLKTRAYNNAGGLWMINQHLRTIEDGSAVGCNLTELLAASVMLTIEKELTNTFGVKYKAIAFGTGVFVSNNALLTAKHIVQDRCSDTGITITTADNKKFTVKEIIEDVDDDMALIIINKTHGSYLELGTRPALGENLICISSPFTNNRQLIITWAKVACGIWKEDGTFIYDGFCFNGCSGGPVILRGKVIGVTVARLKGSASLGFACPVERLDPELMGRIN